jgi:type I restriction enzyme R subunit
LDCKPEEVHNLQGDEARAEFIIHFKEIQRLKTQLNQYTDIEEENQKKIEALIPEDDLRAFRGAYLETAQQLRKKQNKNDSNTSLKVQQLDFEFVLFASAMIDYDYIMGLIAKYSGREPSKHKITQEQLIGLISSSANLMNEREDIVDFIKNKSDELNGKTEQEIRDAFQAFKTEKFEKEMTATAAKHGLATAILQTFVDSIISRMIFDGEKLTDLLEPLALSWKERRVKELALMEDLVPLLKKIAAGREISGLSAYEE